MLQNRRAFELFKISYAKNTMNKANIYIDLSMETTSEIEITRFDNIKFLKKMYLSYKRIKLMNNSNMASNAEQFNIGPNRKMHKQLVRRN